ncbi:TRAP transporter small permease [Vibrio salinus]|uniref:TRAP transporter small permease n=1 Tax=Vibrio salinus TaxID=2899784 RepID=UPI001E5D11E2|nr:TRAP transporter small permease [Vibrio salinus]MCE0494890.1 TRAP transporter small permease [Vibrio salinus]
MSMFIIRFNRWLSYSVLMVSAVLLGLMALLVFYQVITRFVFDAPSTWSEITARIMMVWMVYITMGCVFREGSMITIGFFVDLLPNALGLWVKRMVTLSIILFLMILIWYGWEMAIRVKSQNVSMVNISAFWLYISIPVGALFSLPALIEWHWVNVERRVDSDTLKIHDATEV